MLRDFAFIRSVLMPGEKVVFATSLHWIVYGQGLFLSLIGGVLWLCGQTLLAQVVPPETVAKAARPLAYAAAGIWLFGAAQLVIAWLKQTSTELVVTDQRVVAKFGILNRISYELLLNKIEGANIEQGVGGQMLGYGTVVVRGIGTNLAPIPDIDAPAKFQNALVAQIGKNQAGSP